VVADLVSEHSPAEVRMLPSPEAEPQRYRGRPLLIVLENYVLAAIGELPADKYAGVGQLVQKVFGGGADWMQTVREQLHLGETLDDALRQMWAKNQAIAQQNAVVLQPEQFAKMVADQNFAQLIDPPLG
jgi:hypothetical protein